MLKEKREQLKLELKNVIQEYGYNNDIKQDVGEGFKKRNLSAIRAMWVLNENLDIQTLTEDEGDTRFLFIFVYSLVEVLKNKGLPCRIKVEDYFTKVEIEKWTDYKEETEMDSIFPIILEDVSKVDDRTWQTTLTAQELNNLDANNALIYNFKTQRNPKITSFGEKINMDKTKVMEIKERLLNGEQYPDAIKLNVLKTDIRPQYNEKKRQLIIPEGCVINIFDGYHRKTANSLAIEENPNLEFRWQITIANLSEKQAHDYMSQIDKQKPIKKEYIQQMDYTQPENLIIDAIMDNKLSELAKVMKDSDDYIKQNRALTKKSIIATAIKEVYGDEIKISTNIRNISNWIVEFTDYLMGLYVDEFIINPYEIKKTSFINHKNTFNFYISLSKELRDKANWKELLKEKMSSIDFSKENQMWRSIGLLDNVVDAKKPTRNKLYSLAEAVE